MRPSPKKMEDFSANMEQIKQGKMIERAVKKMNGNDVSSESDDDSSVEYAAVDKGTRKFSNSARRGICG